MKDRPFLKELIRWGIAVGLAIIALKYGINIPPPQFPTPEPTPPELVQPPRPQADPAKAISRITFGRSGCTATPIGERRPDGRYWVLTAAHCISGPGQRGNLTTQRGDRLTVTVVGVDKRADCAWLLTDSTNIDIPFAIMADDTPPTGTRVWHKGYGVHVPGNREDGIIVAGPNSDGQIQMRLSVSSGDSGGAICIDSDGRVVSCVCCTTAMGQLADVWGAGPRSILTLQKGIVDDPEWEPLPIPIRKEIPEKMP